MITIDLISVPILRTGPSGWVEPPRRDWPAFDGVELLEYPTLVGRVARLHNATVTGNRRLPAKKRQRKKCAGSFSRGPAFGNAMLCDSDTYRISKLTHQALNTFLPDLAMMYPDTVCFLTIRRPRYPLDERPICIGIAIPRTAELVEIPVHQKMLYPSSFELRIREGKITVDELKAFIDQKVR